MNVSLQNNPESAASSSSTTNELVSQSQKLLTPQADHDGHSFQQLQLAYNFRNISDRRRVFTNLIVQELKSRANPTVLDIGCGCGMARENSWQWAIRPYAGTYLGIEPDPNMVPAQGLYDQTQTAVMETSRLPENSVDVAYSWMVMEHVENPVAFCEKLYSVLKPGGVYFYSTPNIKHYFTFVAKFLKQLKIDEMVLNMIRKQEQVEDYHYPVQYKFNDERTVAEVANQVGFDQPQFAYVEVEGPINYFPGPTKLLFHALAWKRTKIQRPDALLTMMGRIQKPAS